MNETVCRSDELWEKVLAEVQRDLSVLPWARRAWAQGALREVAALQQELDRLFSAAGGEGACARCQGACCGCGRNHFTLANLLGYLLLDELPPSPDFSLDCPFLGPAGCRLDAGRRPFNCVIFLCEELETGLSSADRERFCRVEKELREIYGEFERRFAGAGMRGLLLRAERLGGQSLLAPPEVVVL